MENQEARAIRAERAAIKLGNQTARAAINLFVNRDIKTMDQTIKELLYPTVATQQGFPKRRTRVQVKYPCSGFFLCGQKPQKPQNF